MIKIKFKYNNMIIILSFSSSACPHFVVPGTKLRDDKIADSSQKWTKSILINKYPSIIFNDQKIYIVQF